MTFIYFVRNNPNRHWLCTKTKSPLNYGGGGDVGKSAKYIKNPKHRLHLERRSETGQNSTSLQNSFF